MSAKSAIKKKVETGIMQYNLDDSECEFFFFYFPYFILLSELLVPPPPKTSLR